MSVGGSQDDMLDTTFLLQMVAIGSIVGMMFQSIDACWRKQSGSSIVIDIGDKCDTILQRAMKKIQSVKYVAPIWARGPFGGHIHTFYAVTMRRSPPITWSRDALTVEFNGTVSIDEPVSDRPLHSDPKLRQIVDFVVVIVPGIGGSSEQHYVRAIVHECLRRGWHAAVFNHRGCGSQPLTSPHLFTFGDTLDIDIAMRHLKQKYPRARFGMVGCSMGANLLVNYLALTHAERGDIPILAAVSLCQAFDARRANRALPRHYERVLLAKMQKLVARHATVLRQHGQLDVDAILAASRTNAFDDLYTCKLHGRWRDADHYYDDASCLPRLKTVQVPTLLFNAADDPLVPAELVEEAREQARTNPFLAVALSDVGGHLGHAAGFVVPDARSFADHIIGDFFAEMISCDQDDD